MFHECGSFEYKADASVQSDTGSGYAGIRVYVGLFFLGGNYREYLSVKLTEPLKAGRQYIVSFNARLSANNGIRYATDNVGIWFSKDSPSDTNLFEVSPQIKTKDGEYISSKNSWTSISSCYYAAGDENYLTLGNFADDDNTNLLTVPPFGLLASTSYYYIDEILVEEVDDNPINLGTDTLVCENTLLNLSSAIDADEYLWNTGATSKQISTLDSGTFALEAKLGQCIFNDTISISHQTAPILELRNDTILCNGDSIEVGDSIPNGNYTWSDGNTNYIRSINSPGTYSLIAEDGICTVQDAVTINYISAPVTELGPDTLVCESDIIYLDVSHSASSYLWQDGSDVPQYEIHEPGKYWITVSNQCGSSNDTLVISHQAHSDARMPNVITPNSDGINDTFEVANIDVCQWRLEVYNRWGVLVYSNEDYDNSWPQTRLTPGLYHYALFAEHGGDIFKGWIKVVL